MTLRPKGITADRTKQNLTILWEDDHESIYSFSLLRHACPCAACRGGHERMTRLPDEHVFAMADEDTPATHLVNVQAVGSYALSIAWEDGHDYGIYNWEYLRALCPCPICRPAGITDPGHSSNTYK
jgi:DUF971 family protein